MYELYNAFEPVIPVFIILFFAVVFITLVINSRSGYKLDNRKKIVSYLTYVGLVMTLIGMALVTLLPGHNPEKVTSFIPFLSIIETWEYATTRAIINSLLMNIILFVPFGFFVYLLLRRAFWTVFLAFVTSVAIEFLQYILPIGRISNVDDVLLNTIGGFVGMVCGSIFAKFGIVYYIKSGGNDNNKH
ncbi:MAG TPA: VanZ family protein [Candidatus Salinicoccus stercoripullorum]|uniref:VanZ family protein n=1 Tax=Candidatus Salinicoccus stercoripullorum TaxID=2838756 RepID=A0A9D1TZS6_9STAP|nr:VanZ family protein [Candidatus Salinicoccus stercoripullorum]